MIFVRGLARDVTESDIRKDISTCGLWAKDVRIVQDSDSGTSCSSSKFNQSYFLASHQS